MVAVFAVRILHYVAAAILAATLAAGAQRGGGAPRHARGSAIDLAPFEALARKADCAQSSNRLFVIDGQLVYWDRAGFCGDNAYAYTLYGETPDRVLCSLKDSFVGPRRACEEAVRPLFETIVQHRTDADLGLGPGHDVQFAFVGAGPQ